MTKQFLLFAVKCSVILYIIACTDIGNQTISRSATPVVTKGIWKINLYQNTKNNDLAGYIFTFYNRGEIKASKNGVDIIGNWKEDNIAHGITLDLGNKDKVLSKLNKYWNISSIDGSIISLQNSSTILNEKMTICML